MPQLTDFARCVRTGARPLIGLDEEVQMLHVAHAIRASAESGSAWVPVQAFGDAS